jgi:hypothetical protein
MFFNLGPAGIGELEHASDFVEGFACGVIDGAAEELVVAVALGIDEEGVATRDDEAEMRRDGS